MSRLYYIYALIRQMFQPWWVPNAARLPPDKEEKAETGPILQPIVDPSPIDDGLTAPKKKIIGPTDTIQPGEMLPPNRWATVPKGIFVTDLPDPMPDDILEMTVLPPAGHVWHYHDSTTHELLSHLLPERGFDFKGRNDQARKRLKAGIYPINNNKPYDRTHLIPFGYHGVEADPKLLVGWDSVQNQGPMNKFEQRQKKRKKPILWLARITKTPDGAALTYQVFDVKNHELIDEETYIMKSEFMWKAEL